MNLKVSCVLLFAGAAFICSLLMAQNPKSAGKRAKPPKFDSAKASEYFFEDVFTKLVGERPSAATATAGPAAASPGTAPNAPAASTGGAATGGAGTGWSKVISAATIEDEVKAIKQEVDKNITTPSDFAGRGHKVIRREFSMLAILFGIIAEYDGDVRFKKDAPAARNLFARTANNTKAGGNTNVFSEVKLRKADLDDLLSGSSLAAAGADAAAADWSTVDRSPLMQRLEAAFQTKLTPSLASKGEFSKHASAILREAEIVSALANVLTKEGMNDADDETYAGLAKGMKSAAIEIVEGVKLKNYDQARAAAGKIDKACSQCHEAYR